MICRCVVTLIVAPFGDSPLQTPIEYKAVIYQEGMLGSLLLGGSKVNPVKFTAFLNKQADEGWRVRTMEKDNRRMLLLWKREAYVVIMERPKTAVAKVAAPAKKLS